MVRKIKNPITVAILFFGVCAIVLAAPIAVAQNKFLIDVGKAHVRKSLLAFPALKRLGSAFTAQQEREGDELYAVIDNDLLTTGLFRQIEPSAFLENPMKTGLRPSGVEKNGFDFKKWSAIGTEFLIKGGYQVLRGQVILNIYAYYVPKGNLVLGRRYTASQFALRRLAHTFANDFVKAVTGKPSFFLHHLVVAIDHGPKTHREIYTMDWDGYNKHRISFFHSIAVSPSWSPNGRYIAYSCFIRRRIRGLIRRNLDLLMYDAKTHHTWIVSSRNGNNMGADFFPDNRYLLVSLTHGRASDIYKMSRNGHTLVALTHGPGMSLNVEPAISPNGKEIAFSSDRSGRPMIYTMTSYGTDVKRRTFLGQYNATPAWSPNGKKLAFASYDKHKQAFDIFIMNADGTGQVLRLTSAHKPNGRWANNIDPIFTPDGRQIVFVSNRSGNNQLYIVDTNGDNERRITHDNLWYYQPKWGP